MDSESIEPAIVSNPSSSSTGEKLFPPGFRFHPTDEELIVYYLKRKICGRSLKLDIIGDVDVYKWDPHDLPGQSKWKTGDRQWFFFSPRDRKYPNGGRSNRATVRGYWKATGADRTITCNSRSVGIKKTLVYYQGRAPSGQRTDWVMHEYTLGEEELKRCRYVKEYYALYKVFKKSGPGPKNGEQYGAPFVEEDWAEDDEYLDIDALLAQNINTRVNEPKFTNGAMVEPEIGPSTESQKSLLACTTSQVDDVDQRMAMDSSHKVLHVHTGSDLAESANEPSVITSVEEVQPLVINEDFLELDDLISPQPALQNSQLPVLDDMRFADLDGFCAFDFCNDSTTFNGINPFESQQSQQLLNTSNLDYGMENSDFQLYLNGTGSGAINTEFQTGYDLCTHDQSNNNFTGPQASEATIPTSSGLITDEKPGKSDFGVNQFQKRGDDGSDSWFSSALWAFVESVPTSPASDLESSDLVNRGFSRVSYTNGSGLVSVERKRSSSRSGSIVYFSVLGVLFAILCVCVGTSTELLGRFIS